MKKELSAPERAEVIFDLAYLAFLVAAIAVFFAHRTQNGVFGCWCAAAVLLFCGDSCHLLPRVRRALHGETERVRKLLGAGLAVSSVCVTAFYLALTTVWLELFPLTGLSRVLIAVLLCSAVFRIAVCLFPQNHWIRGPRTRFWSLLRNIPFCVTGLCAAVLFGLSDPAAGLRAIWAAIAVSFVCYMPVTVLSGKYPKIGMLMIPKTCAYIWVLALGLHQIAIL